VNALAKKQVGDYLDRHFVSAYQRVGTFLVAGDQKQGGNVAAYFCTPDGLVLHAVAGPVDEATFLREARWAVETYHLAALKNVRTEQQAQAFYRKAHLERLKTEHGISAHDLRLTAKNGPIRDWKTFFHQNQDRLGANQGKVHLLLAATPVPRLSDVYQFVFDRILGERISTNPVAVIGK
jgi:hypothetical protein